MTNVDDALHEALQPLGLPVYPVLYTGTDLEYIVTNHNAIPQVEAERIPNAALHLCTVRYFLPWKKNPNPMILQISRALFEAGFSWPTVTPAADNEGQIYALECRYVNAGGAYGQT